MIKIENLSVSYGANRVYEGFDLDIEDGEITCILGESGCGKTTLLNAIAGLLPHGGVITPVKCSYVFQSARLMPYVTALKNLTAVGAGEQEANEMLKKVGLADRGGAYASTLSGGEAQRVALCRAFLFKSQALLMDEPFSSLDIKTKLSVMKIFADMQRAEGRTAVFVTHDVDEALYLADRIIVLSGGKLIKDFRNSERGEFGANSPLRKDVINALLDGGAPPKSLRRSYPDN